MSSTLDEKGTGDDVQEDSETNPRVDVNEDALEKEVDRRTVEFEVAIDDVHATAVDQLEDAGVNVEQVLKGRLRPSVEQAIHDVLQQAKYSE